MKSKMVSFTLAMALQTGLLGDAQPTSPIKQLKSVAEYNEAKNSSKPAIIVFNSETCGACITMEPFVKAAAENPEYTDKVTFYTITPEGDTLQLLKSEEIKAYPTTLFFKDGKEVRRERGGLTEKEINDTTYRLIHGKAKEQPLIKKAATSVRAAGNRLKKAATNLVK